MIELVEHKDGIVLPVKAQPGARRNAVVGEHAGALKVAVTQKPELGKANEAIVEVLAKHLGIAKSKIELMSGSTSKNKSFLIGGMTLQSLHQKLNSIST